MARQERTGRNVGAVHLSLNHPSAEGTKWNFGSLINVLVVVTGLFKIDRTELNTTNPQFA